MSEIIGNVLVTAIQAVDKKINRLKAMIEKAELWVLP